MKWRYAEQTFSESDVSHCWVGTPFFDNKIAQRNNTVPHGTLHVLVSQNGKEINRNVYKCTV